MNAASLRKCLYRPVVLGRRAKKGHTCSAALEHRGAVPRFVLEETGRLVKGNTGQAETPIQEFCGFQATALINGNIVNDGGNGLW